VYYVKLPVTKKPVAPRSSLFSIDRFNVFSILTKDHGAKDAAVGWYDYIVDQLSGAGFTNTSDLNFTMITHPRLFGYAFNPITFWLACDSNGDIRAVLCEVRNTFKQSHNYLLFKKGFSKITPEDTLVADKKLYVSPFNTTEGHYEFNFTYQDEYFKAVINYFNGDNTHVLNTYVGGAIKELTTRSIVRAVCVYPVMTAMVVVRIHWQALKLYVKKVKHTLKWLPAKYKNNQTSTGGQKNKT
jgi:DUF1365 family protein